MPLQKHEIDSLIASLAPYERYIFQKCDFCKEFKDSELDYCTCSSSKTLEDFRKKLESEKKKHYYSFKVHKNNDMSEAEFVKKVLHLPTKFKGWFKQYHFNVEFNVESGIHPHTHIALSDVDKRKDKLTKKREQLQKYFSTPANMVFGQEVDATHHQNNVNYIKGLKKSEEKQSLVEMDKNSREKYNLDLYYNAI